MKNFIFIILILQIFTTSIIAQSGIVFLPPNDGRWVNCTTDLTNESFSIKIVDFSLPVTVGFGKNLVGNYSNSRTQGIGVSVSSYTLNFDVALNASAISEMTNTASIKNVIYYCDTLEFLTTQCSSSFKGLPSPDQKERTWCIDIINPFSNGQKVYVSFTPDLTSTNSTKIAANSIANGSEMVNTINRKYFLLTLVMMFSILCDYF
ncbi:hypothetical protein C2G38_2087255 [Gigaspora rosea]|uniref:Reelin domain-containing protein n=1 Tax=Gigaspora rosea TaxID=44941 RepID=A0A397V5K2_9GLOM|nr:hypothetical protein C2G38_2087255 [Gigaspora rosea]